MGFTLYHTDVQGDWFLIDLESAAPIGQRPGSFRCKQWTALTLTGDIFTDKSDIEMVGNLFGISVSGISDMGQQLQQRMCLFDPTQRPSATQALLDPWFVMTPGYISSTHR